MVPGPPFMRVAGLIDEVTQDGKSCGLQHGRTADPRKLQRKIPQLARGPAGIARVLSVCLSHHGASALLGTLAARWVVTSPPKITMTVPKEGKPAASPRLTVDLKHSAFFSVKQRAIVPVRELMSAILLVSIWERQLEIVGMLHPAPQTPLEYHLFRDVPFLRVNWPIENAEINTEWVVASPRPVTHFHRKVTPTDKKLTDR